MMPDEPLTDASPPDETPAPLPEPLPETPPPDLPFPQGLLESQRDALMAQLTTYPPFHAEHKRMRSAIAGLEAAIRERNRTAS